MTLRPIYEPKRRNRQPIRRLAPDTFPPLGGELLPRFETVQQAKDGVKYAQNELWRLEKSMAIIEPDNAALPQLHSARIFDVLDMLFRSQIIAEDNLAAVHQMLVSTLSALAAWTTAVIDSPKEALSYGYVVKIGLRNACSGILALGIESLDKYQQTYIRDAISSSDRGLEVQDASEDTESVPTDAEAVKKGQKSDRRSSIWKMITGQGRDAAKDDKGGK